MFAQYYRQLIVRSGVVTCLKQSFLHILVFSLCIFFIVYLLQTIIHINLYRLYIFISIFVSIGLGLNFILSCRSTVKGFSFFCLSGVSYIISISIPFLVGALQIFLPSMVDFDIYYYASDTYDVAIIMMPAMSIMYPMVIVVPMIVSHWK